MTLANEHGPIEAPLVVVVEDDPSVRLLLARILETEGYRVVAVGDGEAGLLAIGEHQPDLVILDLNMPRLDGYQVCRRLRADERTVALPVIMLTGHTTLADMVAGLDAGADDFISKPFRQAELLARIRSAFRMRQVVRRMDQAHSIVAALANAVEAKDPNLDNHCRRLAYRATRLAASVGLAGSDLEGVAYGALLHDIGKIAVPEAVLHKIGKLDDSDREILRRHPEIGEQICRPLIASRAFAPIIRQHHERWDGAGYPDGMQGEAITLGARIVGITDAFEAIVFGRPYRAPRSQDEAFDELRRESGHQFDPGLVPLFIDEMERLEHGDPPSAELPPAAMLDRDHLVHA
jgi:putative two-component system response regulator